MAYVVSVYDAIDTHYERLSTIDLDVGIASVSPHNAHRETPIDTTAERGMTSCAPARNQP